MSKTKLIVDTDPGIDDLLALFLLLKSSEFDIRAITTVAGNSTIENVTKNAQAILDFAGSKVPIYSGSSRPLKRDLVTAVVHGDEGLGGFDTTRTKFELTSDAPEKIVEIVHQNPGKMTLLTLGPLTNIAEAFMLDPELPSLVAKIVSMGGAVNVSGNKNGVSEFNFFIDPEAASLVYQSKTPKVLVPLDICNQMELSLADFEGIKNESMKSMLIPMMKPYLKALIKDENTTGILVYDALAAYYLINPDAFRAESIHLEIDTGGEDRRGRCVVKKGESVVLNVSVVTSLNQEKFRRDFINILSIQSPK